MKMIQSGLIAIFIFACAVQYSWAYLIFPPTALMQITCSTSSPIKVPNHKMYFDWGYQMNYFMVSNMSYYYNPPPFPGIFNKREAKELDYNKYGIKGGVHPGDYTAGEIYTALEDRLVDYGFHETCLLKSVCELAKHPFHDDEQNLITEILTFILSPSIHEAFGEDEVLYKETYEKAEELGFLGKDCSEAYPDCTKDFISLISSLISRRPS